MDLELVAHFCNPSTWEAEIGRVIVQGQPRQIVQEIPSLKQPEQNGLKLWFK
jgi:hypothetical protein